MNRYIIHVVIEGGTVAEDVYVGAFRDYDRALDVADRIERASETQRRAGRLHGPLADAGLVLGSARARRGGPLVTAVSETQLLLVEQQGRSLHIVDPDDPTLTCCRRPLAGNGQFGHPHKEDLTPAPWHGDAAGPRQRTVYDVRWKDHLYSICRRCRENAAIK